MQSLFGKLRGCDRCLGVEGMRSLLLCVLCGSLKKGIGRLRGCDRFWGVEGMRSAKLI